jgi:hypothetical protein
VVCFAMVLMVCNGLIVLQWRRMLTYRYAYAGASIGILTCGCDGRCLGVKVFLRNVADGIFI